MIAANPTIALAAGGTGGHVFPAEALAQELLAHGHRLVLFTDRRGAVYGGALGGLETIRINAGAIAGKGPLARAGAALNIAQGFFEARQALREMRPAAVVGFGGYAAAPTMLAALNLNLRTVLHEQNAVLGRANRMLASRVDRVCLSFELTKPLAHAKIAHTGMPVRPAIAALHSHVYAAPASDGPFRILITGGSQGAHVFSAVLPAAIALLPRELRNRLEIAQQCRLEDLNAATAAYQDLGVRVELEPFFENVPELLSKTHLLIARSGASTVAEAAVAARPSLFVPYPHAADDHQTANADAIAKAGGAWLVPQPQFTPEALAARLVEFARQPALLARAASAAAAFSIPDAASRLAGVVTSVIRNGNGARQASGVALRSTSIEPGAV